ncbi:TMEM165/GDT1 family protein [Sphingomonas sp. MMS24-JH45]
MAALVLGAITQGLDRTPWLAAILADRLGRATTIVALILALAANYAIGVAGGRLLAPVMTPEAKLLLLALALALAGLGTGWRVARPEALERWRLPGGLTAVLGLFIMAFGDRMQFVVAALAAESAALGRRGGRNAGAGLAATAAAMGEAAWLKRCSSPAIRLAAAVVLTVAGIVVALNALRLV